MSLTTLRLLEFVQLSPVCGHTATLAELLSTLSSWGLSHPDDGDKAPAQADRVAIVNEQEFPVGLVHLGSLMPHLFATQSHRGRGAGELGSTGEGEHGSWGARELGRTGAGELGNSGESPLSPSPPCTSAPPPLQQPLSALDPPCIAPIYILPAHLNLSEFWAYLQDQNDSSLQRLDWALVAPSGKFLGLLDTRRLLKFLAQNCALSLRASSDPPVETSPQKRSTLPDLRSPDLPPVAAAGSPRPYQNFCTPLFVQPQLVQLLEHLPIPVMLQTGTGQLLSQNHAWRRQFGEELQPDITPRPEDPAPASDRYHTGKEVNYSIGVCPMPNDSDRVWEFVKIPLGLVLPSTEGTTSVSAQRVTLASSPKLRAAPGAEQAAAPGADIATGGAIRLKPEQGFTAIAHLATLSPPHPLTPTPDTGTSSAEALWLVLAQEVTEQQLLAKELAAKNADLVQLNRLKDEFLACISHELKTPLTAVLGLSTLLKDQSLGQLNERQARYAQLIYQSGRHLMTVVNDILDLTRMETGQMELILEPVQIAAVCDRAIAQAKAAQQPSELPAVGAAGSPRPRSPEGTDAETLFTLEIEPGLNTLVADEMRLRQMLQNLLSNALKFTPLGGEIGLRVSQWSGWIAFTVWDTGIGIPAEKQHLIFQKFQQLESPLTRQFEGTGLGLVLTRAIARSHGGEVSFTSSEGKGSQFTLLLPPCPPQPTAASVGAAGSARPHAGLPRPDADNRLVLLVEAVPRFIVHLTEQLNALGYRVAIGRSGTDALEKARRLQPCVVFLNPLLPLLSGWDVLTLLKSDSQTRHIPAIVMTTRVEKERADRNQADGFLSLPVSDAALREILERLMSPPPLTTQDTPPTGLTILHLRIPESEVPSPESRFSTSNSAVWTPDSLLHAHHYRVLEADDLEQAELLARVWQPDVVLLNTAHRLRDPSTFIQQLSQRATLASVPLVTLDRKIAEAANQVPGLRVFPCLKPAIATSGTQDESSPDTAALLQVIQLAAGISQKPSILVMDICSLPEFFSQPSAESDDPSSCGSEWVQALVQYIQTAGFRCLMGRSWSEFWHQLQHQLNDMLLICLGDSLPLPVLVQALKALAQLPALPPVLVLDRRFQGRAGGPRPHGTSHAQSLEPPQSSELASLWQAIAAQILPPSLSMEELLDLLNQTLQS